MADYRTPSPDEGHEALRAPLAQAIDDLAEHITRLDDAYLLLLGAAHMAQSTLDAITAAQQALTALAGRVAELEAAQPTPAPAPAPDPATTTTGGAA